MTYDFKIDDLPFLSGAALFQDNKELQTEMVEKLVKGKSQEEVINLIVNLFRVCNSVIKNNVEGFETMAVTQFGQHPNSVLGKMNLPSLFGAFMGLPIAEGINQEKLCGECAFRKGSVPNQSEVTVIDASYCLDGDTEFQCHANADGKGRPGCVCLGYAQKLKTLDRKGEKLC